MNLRDHPEIMKIKEGNESIEDIMSIEIEHILIRWINYHMEKGEYPYHIDNITSDMKDG